MSIIYGGPERYEVQWLGASGNWWHQSWHKRRWTAVLRARLALSSARVIDHQSGDPS